MNDEATPPADETAAEPAPPAAEPATAVMDEKEVADGKTFAILSYALSFIGIPFFLVPLIMRNNDFSLYHSKQCLILWLAGMVVGVLGSILAAVCIGLILLPLGALFLLVLDIMGLVNAVNGEAKPLPVIGKWGEEWFQGITKA